MSDKHHHALPSDLEIRVKALESLLVEKGLVDPGALDIFVDTYENRVGPRNGARVVEAASPRFKTGDRVRVVNRNPEGHTRAPRYVRDRTGIIVHDHGVFIYPDTHAHGRGRSPQHVYSVRFEAAALWGPEIHAPDSVYVDLWDPYLESAET